MPTAQIESAVTHTAPDALMTPDEAAAYLRLDPRTLANWRALGRGPRYVRAGRVRYLRRDLDRWLEAHAREPEAPARRRGRAS